MATDIAVRAGEIVAALSSEESKQDGLMVANPRM